MDRQFDQRLELWPVWSCGYSVRLNGGNMQSTGCNNSCNRNSVKIKRGTAGMNKSHQTKQTSVKHISGDSSHFGPVYFWKNSRGKKETVAHRCVITQHVCVAPTNLIHAWAAKNTCSAPAPADVTKPIITQDYSELASLCFFCPFISSPDETKKKKKKRQREKVASSRCCLDENWRAACQRITRRANIFQQVNSPECKGNIIKGLDTRRRGYSALSIYRSLFSSLNLQFQDLISIAHGL